MFSHYSQIITFFQVCQSVNWLTSLLKLDKYGDISCSGWDIPRMISHYFQIVRKICYVCQSISWLTSLLKFDKCRNISCSGWVILLKIFGDIPRIFSHYLKIIINFLYVCQSIPLCCSSNLCVKTSSAQLWSDQRSLV